MRLIFSYARRYGWLVAFCLVTKMLASLAELFIPELLAVIIDDAVPSGDINRVWLFGGIMLSLALASFLLNVLSNRFSARASGNLGRDIRASLFRRTMELDAPSADKYGTASLTSRLTSDTYNVSSFFGRLLRMGVRAPILTVGGVILTLFIDWRLALVLISVLPLVFIVVYKITKSAIPIYQEEQEVLDGIVTQVDETAKGIRVIKALSKTEYEKKRFFKRSGALANKEIEAGRLMSLTKPLTDLILNVGFCAVVLLGAILARQAGFSASGKLLAFMTYFTIMLNSMIMMTRTFVQLSRCLASAGRIEEVLNSENSVKQESCAPTDRDGYIVFDNVSFSYNKRRKNIDGVSFSINKGETLGIIGATGSGKSTLISLLMRLYDADSGSIYIDKRNIKSIPKEELYSLFGVAFQNDFVPALPLRDNVDFFRGKSDEQITEALNMAVATEFTNDLEDGLSHGVTTGGTNLSGGQRQRLLVARAILSGSEIIVLDDSSSALDYKTDSILRSNLAKLTGKTKVIVSQRISSVMNCDLILVMSDGKIIGKGNHASLIRDCEEYVSIAKVQMGD